MLQVKCCRGGKGCKVELQGQLLQHTQGTLQMPAESTVAHLPHLNHNHMVPADHGVAGSPHRCTHSQAVPVPLVITNYSRKELFVCRACTPYSSSACSLIMIKLKQTIYNRAEPLPMSRVNRKAGSRSGVPFSCLCLVNRILPKVKKLPVSLERGILPNWYLAV